MPPHVHVFDLDDTLYLERDYQRSGFRAVEDWLWQAHDIEGFAEAAWQLFEQGVRGTTMNLALEELGLQPTPDLVHAAVGVFREHRPHIHLLPDADAALQALRDEGVPTAIITDGFVEVQQAKVHALGLEKRVGLIVYSDALGTAHRKPDPLPFRTVMEHFGVPGEACTYYGDNPAKDFIGARRLGWRTVRIRRPGGEHAAADPRPGHEADQDWPDLTRLTRGT